MAHNPVTIEVIRTLDAIDRQGSFAAAAEVLHKVPSALTYTIQKCERDLNLVLFDRSGHRAQWTPAARHILQEGRRLLVSLENLGHSAQRLAQGWALEYVIAMDHLLSFQQVLPLLQQARGEIPWVSMHVERGTLSGTWELLLERHADLVLAPLSALPSSAEDIDTEVLGNIEMVLAVAPTHPLASAVEGLTEADLAAYPVVVNPDTARLHVPLNAGLRQRKQELRVPDMDHKIEAQKQGLGIGLLPLHRIQSELASGQLVVKTLVPALQPEPMVVVAGWRSGDRDQTHQWVRQHLHKLAFGSPANLSQAS
jgi:DNA-binding transcriptional LysR family regulator